MAEPRELAAHLAVALTRYATTTRAEGVEAPVELVELRDALVKMARGGQGVTFLAGSGSTGDGAGVERLAFSAREAAEALGVSERSVRRLIADGSLPAARVGGRRVIARAALEDLTRGVRG